MVRITSTTTAGVDDLAAVLGVPAPAAGDPVEMLPGAHTRRPALPRLLEFGLSTPAPSCSRRTPTGRPTQSAQRLPAVGEPGEAARRGDPRRQRHPRRPRPQLVGEGTVYASDANQFVSWSSNLMTEHHVRYGGPGVMIYWHVERRSACIHSQLMRG